jgi:hypothetical protein
MPGIQGLSREVHCSGPCLITHKETSRGGDKVVQMYDRQCYYIHAITKYVIRKIREGLTLGDPNFTLPTRAPITLDDLRLLNLDPADFPRMIMEWENSDEYQRELAEENDAADAAAQEYGSDDSAEYTDGSDAEYADGAEIVHFGEEGEATEEINTVMRWGFQYDINEFQRFPISLINRVDNYVLRGRGRDSDNPYDFDYTDDENIENHRNRNLGLHEFQNVIRGLPIGGPGFNYGITFNYNVYQTLDELAEAMEKPINEIQLGTSEGGRKPKKNKTKMVKKAKKTKKAKKAKKTKRVKRQTQRK